MPTSQQTPRSLITARRFVGSWPALAAVAAGGLAGSAGRTMIGLWIGSADGSFPTAVLIVNLVGSGLLGFYLARRERAVSRRLSLHFWAIGALGSFTTFSAFSVDLVQLVSADRPLVAVGYAASSLVGGLAAALGGQRIGGVVR